MVLINFVLCKTRPSPLIGLLMRATTPPQQFRTDGSLRARSLTCVRGERRLFEQLDVTINAGQCLHVTGANGSGKTSLLRILCGISRPELGELRWHGISAADNTGFTAQVAYIGHKDGLKNELSAAENLSFYQALNNRPNEDLVDQYLDRLGILRCADLPANQLSFGQRRRLAFARLLVQQFQLWILDEPFTGVDQQGRGVIEQLCVNHLQADGMIVLTNHQSLRSGPLAAFITELAL